MQETKSPYLVLTGVVGFVVVVLVGTGEFLLHYDPLARFSAFVDRPSASQSVYSRPLSGENNLLLG